MHVAVWIALGLVVFALVALVLLGVSVMQRLGPLQRAQARLLKRVEAAQSLAGELQEVQKQSLRG
ncbi:MAG: hypothetical protein HOQ05_05075 [Corynebacteriales bacterium]|nr:hypothetical protein [Mycobacteriales bacterium]